MNDYKPGRAILLARISDARNGEDQGVQGQLQVLREEATRRGWTVGPDKTHVITENDVSGFKRHAMCPSCLELVRDCRCPPLPNGSKRRTVQRTWRPAFRKALLMLESGEADGLLVFDLDRLARDVLDLDDLITVVKQLDGDVAVDSYTGSLRELHTSAGRQTARILMDVAVKSSEDTQRRVADRRRQQAAGGWYGGGARRPYGYRPDPKAAKYRKTLLVVPAEAAELRSWADQLLAGVSLRTLAADLRARKVPSVTGATWDTQTIRDALLKPTVAGLAVHDVRGAARKLRKRGEPVPFDAGVVGKAQWPAILDESTWRAVASKLTDPSRRSSTRGNTPRWLGSLIYRCGRCAEAGVVETVSISAGDAAHNPAYKCRGPRGHLRRAAHPVDAYVEEVVIARLAQPDAVGLIRTADDSVDRDALSRERNTLRERRARILRLVADGTFTEAEARAQSRKLNERLTEIDAKLNTIAERGPLDELPLGTAEVAEVWARLPLGSKRAILRTLMTVTLERGKPGRYSTGAYFDGSSVIIEWRQ